VHIVEAGKFNDIVKYVEPTTAPKRRPADPEPVMGEEIEVDAYRDDWINGLDEPIESKLFGRLVCVIFNADHLAEFEIRDLGGTYAKTFTSVRDHVKIQRQH